MRSLVKTTVLIVALLALSACPLQTREDVEKQEEQKQLKEQVSAIQKTRADTESKYSDLQNDIRVVAGRVDSLDHNQQTNQQNYRQDMEALKKMVENQNEKIKVLEQHIDATETRLMAAIQSENAASAVPSQGGTAKEPAKKKENPLDEAESFFASKEFKRAIVKYQAYIDKNPKGPAVAEATYKIGVCFAELGLKKEAKDSYKDTIDNFGGSPWAKKAKYRLSHIK